MIRHANRWLIVIACGFVGLMLLGFVVNGASLVCDNYVPLTLIAVVVYHWLLAILHDEARREGGWTIKPPEDS